MDGNVNQVRQERELHTTIVLVQLSRQSFDDNDLYDPVAQRHTRLQQMT